MLGSKILEVAIGIIFVFILVSIICAALREGIEGWFKTRAAYLEYGIREMLHDSKAEGIAKSFFNHPLIYSLFSGDYHPRQLSKSPSLLANGKNLPSYIPSKNFALALMDMAARGPETDVISSDPGAPIVSLESIRRNILNLQNEPVQRVLLTAIDSAQGDINKAQENIEAWYNSAMDRISGWYKRSTQWVLFWIGLAVAILLNVNTITISDFLYRNDAARSAMVARAEAAAKDNGSSNYEEARKELDSLSLPIGWTTGWGAPRPRLESWPIWKTHFTIWNDALAPIIGILITALAATLGAPFWFDVLNKVMVVRSTVKPHEKSPEEASEDRQFPGKQPTVAKEQVPEAATQQKIEGGEGVAPVQEEPLNPLAFEGDMDGCDLTAESVTLDEELPAAEGGVA